MKGKKQEYNSFQSIEHRFEMGDVKSNVSFCFLSEQIVNYYESFDSKDTYVFN